MTSIRKKKKVKVDIRASEQMRNWLLKEKKEEKSVPPVTFKDFKKFVQNLPDIAFQIQSNEPGSSNKTLDECAEWYYHAFYRDPSVRTKYAYILRSCPLRMKQKLLQDFSALESVSESDDDGENVYLPSEDGYEVVVKNCGRFIFPVSFNTFKRYIDKNLVINRAVRKLTKDKAERAELLANNENRRKFLRKFYNSFYIFTLRRKDHMAKCNFHKAPEALRKHLLKVAVPLDKLGAQTLDQHYLKAANTTSETSTDGQMEGFSSIVSFTVFEKYVKNIYNIVWSLKLNDPEYSYKGFEECARAYYVAFYLKPEIRDKHPYELNPCTTAMKNRILALPNEQDKKMLLEMKKTDPSLAVSQDMNNHMDSNEAEIQKDLVELAELIGDCNEDENLQYHKPAKGSHDTIRVSFNTFKKYIRNLDEIVDQMQKLEDYKGTTREDCALEYYNRFYTDPFIRRQYHFEVKPCPARIREKLLSLPDKDISSIKITPSLTDPLAIERKLVTISGATYEFLVSYDAFVRYVNYEELIAQLIKTFTQQRIEQGDRPTDEELMRRFYYLYYTDERVQKQFKCHFDAAPVELRQKLMQLAMRVKPPSQQQAVEDLHEDPSQFSPAANDIVGTLQEPDHQEEQPRRKSKVSDKSEEPTIKLEDCELDVVEVLGSVGSYRFPVSFNTFTRCLDCKMVTKLLIKDTIHDESQIEAMIADPWNPYCRKMINKYYHSFYVRPITRQKYEYCFENVSAEVMQKLLEYAVPLDDSARKVMAEATAVFAKHFDKTKQKENHAELLEKLPVTFKQFKRYILNLDEIVKEMLKCEEYKCKSEEDCAMEYFTQFYTAPQIRERFAFQIKPCPSKVREMLLQMVNTDEAKELQKSDNNSERVEASAVCVINSNTDRGDKNNVQSEEIVQIVEGFAYKFPVSMETFKRYINYDSVRVQLANCYAKTKEKADKILRDKRSEMVLLRRFYNSFYIDSRIRSMCQYNFNAAPPELRKKLLENAVPLKEIQPSERPKTSKPPRSARHTRSSLENERLVQNEPEPAPELTSLAEVEQETGNQQMSPQSDQAQEKATQDEVDRRTTSVNEQGAEKEAEAVSEPPLKEDQCFPRFELLEKMVPPVRKRQPTAEVQYPVSFNIFSNLINLDEIVPQMQREARYANCTANDCKIAYYRAFYEKPKIRERYKYYIKHCPMLLKEKLLQIPPNSQLSESDSQDGVLSIDAIYASRKAELASMKKSNVVKYAIPQNLKSYIALRTKCPKKRKLLELHFIRKPPNEEPTAKVLGNDVTEPPSVEATAPASQEVSSTPNIQSHNVTSTERQSPVVQKNAMPAAGCTSQIAADKSVNENASSSDEEMVEITLSNEVFKDTNNCSSGMDARVLIPSSAFAAFELFFRPIDREHLLMYLLSTSDGLKRIIWRILSHLSMSEFRYYTAISGGSALYEDKNILSLCYLYVVTRGNWPVNFYVKLKMLPKLLHVKGIKLDKLDLSDLSPKMLSAEELVNLTNFNDIVQRNYLMRKGQELQHGINEEAEKFYMQCWLENRWLLEVPRIMDASDHWFDWPDDPIVQHPIPKPSRNLPPCMIVQHNTSEAFVLQSAEEQQTEANNPIAAPTTEADSNTDLNVTEASSASQDCPSTQLDEPLGAISFVDTDNVCPPTQVVECQNDPLNASSSVATENAIEIKKEPIQFLNMLRFSIMDNSNNSGSFICDIIPSNEQVINLEEDERQEDEYALSCFNYPSSGERTVRRIARRASRDSFQIALAEVLRAPDEIEMPRENMSQCNMLALMSEESQMCSSGAELIIAESAAAEPNVTKPVDVMAEQVEEAPVDRIVAPTSKISAPKKRKVLSSGIDRKRTRLMADNVPQIRHEFRPLPLTAMVRIEPQGVAVHLNKQTIAGDEELAGCNQPVEPKTSAAKHSQVTLSQALSTDNTLMESSQLQRLLDATRGTQQRLTDKEVSDIINDKGSDNIFRSPAERGKRIIFRSLERYMSFNSLTTAQITKYHINSLSVGTPYQQALVRIDGRLCNVYGPLLGALFSYCPPSLLDDLQYLLRDIGEFCYNSRQTLDTDSNIDLRHRVLSMFMRVAPPFTLFRLEYENESREWAVCSEIPPHERAPKHIMPKETAKKYVK